MRYHRCEVCHELYNKWHSIKVTYWTNFWPMTSERHTVWLCHEHATAYVGTLP